MKTGDRDGGTRTPDDRGLVGRIRELEEELRLFLDNAPVGTAMVGLDGRFQRVNRSLCGMFGYDEHELLGKTFQDLTHPDDIGASLAYMERLDTGQVDRFSMSKRWVRKDGKIVFGVVHVAAFRDSTGRPIVYLSQIEDHTERLLVDAELRQNRDRLAHVGRLSAMGEMAASIAHEMNQPLEAIAAYAQASRRRLDAGASSDEIAAALEKISGQAERAGKVIRRLRSFLRNRDSEHVHWNVNTLVQEVVAMAGFDARFHRTHIDLNLAPGLPEVVADGIQIQQVVLNLVRNAIEANLQLDERAEERVRVTTRLAPGGHGVEVAVIDRGPGLGDELAGRIFQPFFTTKSGGTGLGLAISRTIVRSHRGEMGFRNNDEGGATFHFTLPVRES